MMTSSVMNATYGSTADKKTSSTSVMDQNAFLKLLITQLSNQDPMNPMEDRDFIAQLAQFSSLEQMQQLNSNFKAFGNSARATEAFNLVGKWIDYLDAESGNMMTGQVDGVGFKDGVAKLKIGNSYVNLSNIVNVYPGADSLGVAKQTTQAIGLIGHSVSYYDSVTGKMVSGKVSSVDLSGPLPKLVVGNQALSLNEILALDGQTQTPVSDIVAVAKAMIGRKIDYNSSGSIVSGKVTNFRSSGNYPVLIVGSKSVDPFSVLKVY